MKVSANVKFGYVLFSTSYCVMVDRMPVLKGVITAYITNHRKPIMNRATITTAVTYKLRIGRNLGNTGKLIAYASSFSSFYASFFLETFPAFAAVSLSDVYEGTICQRVP